MFTALKRSFPVKACRLGENSALFDKLVQDKKIICDSSGNYRILSFETDQVNGEIAQGGDFVKVDPKGGVYPNKAEYFLQRHIRIGEDLYMQKEQRLPAWDAQEPMSDEIAFLIEKKGLVIDRQSRDRYFSAPLWGTMLYAARDAVIIFYSITRDGNGLITDASFNFVKREVFAQTYERIG